MGADEKIRYYDFTSLYPTVQAKKQYPVGHPQVILKDFESIDKYFGLKVHSATAQRAVSPGPTIQMS
ncbi:hypothetical protein FVA96_24510 [Escherichia coli]|nr:hypothetical protein [Escherichia coli]